MGNSLELGSFGDSASLHVWRQELLVLGHTRRRTEIGTELGRQQIEYAWDAGDDSDREQSAAGVRAHQVVTVPTPLCSTTIRREALGCCLVGFEPLEPGKRDTADHTLWTLGLGWR